MQTNSPILFVEINLNNFIFVALEANDNNQFQKVYTNKTSIGGISDNKISDINQVNDIIKENIFYLEKKLNFVFKEVVLITNNFNCFLINLAGFKRLNGSQLSKDNVTHILNSLKSKIIESEDKKRILHIFNTKYFLDKKNVENLPIGLFGDFYSQELSFFLVDENDYMNLINIFNKCNLKVSKIISKNFLEGISLINKNSNLETFFKIEIFENESEIFFFENSALKFSQRFNFGSDSIIRDISKITALNHQLVKKILSNFDFSKDILESDLIEKNFFDDQNFRKIKKKLIYDIASARIEEIAEIIILKNINLVSFLKKNLTIFLKVNDNTLKCFDKNFKSIFMGNFDFELKIIENEFFEELYSNAHALVQYGWKKESVPVIHEKKSTISRIFNLFFK